MRVATHVRACVCVPESAPVSLCCHAHPNRWHPFVLPGSSLIDLTSDVPFSHVSASPLPGWQSFVCQANSSSDDSSPVSTPGPSTKPPADVPPPTPVNFPQCYPQAAGDGNDAAAAAAAAAGGPQEPLATLLQSIVRPTEVSLKHLRALGVHVRPNARVSDLIPDPSYIPDFAQWDSLSYDAARESNESSRRRLNTGNLSPGVQTYHDRKRELETENAAAFRSVRRMQPPPGHPQVRLGHSYEFFRNLEGFAMFWDDTSAPKRPTAPEPEKPAEAGGSSDTTAGDGDAGAAPASGQEKDGGSSGKEAQTYFFRTGSGTQMPPEYRLNILTSFLKLVAYDFGCNVSAPRTEPRLYLNAPSAPASSSLEDPQAQSPSHAGGSSPTSRSSYFSSGCTFIFRSPQTREAARQGIVEGPLAAVSARHTTAFPAMARPDSPSAVGREGLEDRDAVIDLARELVAALLTAQHRAREGRAERRFGDGAWWATKPRWGGGPGGPIGREVDAAAPNTDEAAPNRDEGPGPAVAPNSGLPIAHHSRGGAAAAGPAAKKPRKNLPMYDNYRMVRPPSASWDKKTRYSAIGRVKGADYDDIFVASALFHHVAVLRVRVPLRLLDALDGNTAAAPADPESSRSWGRLEVLRTQWYDLFLARDRVAAMQTIWSMMAFLMRKEDEDVKMDG